MKRDRHVPEPSEPCIDLSSPGGEGEDNEGRCANPASSVECLSDSIPVNSTAHHGEHRLMGGSTFSLGVCSIVRVGTPAYMSDCHPAL